jgi:hypothetical protein
VADSVKRDSSARVTRPLESLAGGRCRCVADVRDASYPSLLVRYDLSWEKSRARPCRWVTGPSVVSPGCDGRCADRSQVAVALDAVTDLPAAVGFFGCDVPTVPVSGASGRGR